LTPEDLRALAKEHLVPFFSGAALQPDVNLSNAWAKTVAFTDPCTIEFKLNRADPYRLTVRRSQPFAKDSSSSVTEKQLVTAFTDVVREMEPGLSAPYRADLLATLDRRVVAKAVSVGFDENVILDALDQLLFWAGRLYEGRPISAAIGFDANLTPSVSPVSLKDVWRADFCSVLTNGFDTMLVCDRGGSITAHQSLEQNAAAVTFSPFRYAPIAAWAVAGRLAFVLNRLGEILVFKDEKLLFARRAGVWHFITHSSVLTQLGVPNNQQVRRAVYESCLDASFARTGACVGIVNSTNAASWQTLATSRADHLAADSPKALALAAMIKQRKWYELDRRLRQELLAIDGATLLDHNGDLLAVGAILRVPGGSTGGGRLAAAKELSALGLGVKVSQDGGIRAFRSKTEVLTIM